MILFGCVIWVCYLGVGERRVCRGHVVHLGEPKQLQRSCVMFLFSRHFTDDTGLMHFSDFFSLCTWHGSLRFLGVSDYSRVICRYYSYYIDPYIYGLNWWTERYAANQNYQRFPQERMRNEVFHHNAIEALRTYGYDGIWCWNFDQQWRRWQTKIGIQVLPTGKIDHEVLGFTGSHFWNIHLFRSGSMRTDTTADSQLHSRASCLRMWWVSSTQRLIDGWDLLWSNLAMKSLRILSSSCCPWICWGISPSAAHHLTYHFAM